MRILIATDTYKPTVNGVVTSVINLKSGLESLGHEVKILALSGTNVSYYENDIYYIGSLDIGRFYPDVRLKTKNGKKEIKAIINWKPDIIHTQSEFSTFALAKKIAKTLSIPIVHTYHTMYEDYTHYFSHNKTMGKKMVAKLTNYISNHVSAMIAPTDKIYNMLNRYGVACPVEIIPSGISLEKFEQEWCIEEVKKQLNIPSDHFIMVSVSRIGREKNIDELIRCMRHLKDRKITLIIVGDGPYKEELENLVKNLNLTPNIRFTGMISPKDLPVYYQVADLFVSSSTSETQGLTYIEALASGTPILCREDECLNGVLFEGENGYSFNSENGFIQKLESFMAVKNKTSIKTCAKATAKKYSKEHFVKSIVELYKKQLSSKEIEDVQPKQIKSNTKLFNYFSIVLMIALVSVTLYCYTQGYFTSIDELQTLVASVGMWGPLVFVLAQILQVVFPIIPGGIGCLAGVMLFGPLWGFVYNYIGIVMGSFIVFGISKMYGCDIVYKVFPKKVAEKYFKWVDKGERFKKLFAAAIFFPVAPDDLLCYIAGTTKMRWHEYISIIVLGKPLSIAVYSLGLTSISNQVLAFTI